MNIFHDYDLMELLVMCYTTIIRKKTHDNMEGLTMNEIAKTAMLTRWHRMAEANVTGAWDIYSFLKGAIENAADADSYDPWDDTPYFNNKFSDMVEPFLLGFKAINQRGETGAFSIWHTHGVKNAEFSETAFEDLEQMMFNSKVGGVLYANFEQSTIPTYREVWARMNPTTVRKPRRVRKTA